MGAFLETVCAENVTGGSQKWLNSAVWPFICQPTRSECVDVSGKINDGTGLQLASCGLLHLA